MPASRSPPGCSGFARYKLADFYRRRGSQGGDHVDIDDAAEWLATEDHDAHDARRDVGLLLDELPEKQRDAIRCVKIEGLSIAEAAGADRAVGIVGEGGHPSRAEGAGSAHAGCGMKTDDLITLLARNEPAPDRAALSRTLLALVAGGVLVSFLFVYFCCSSTRPWAPVASLWFWVRFAFIASLAGLTWWTLRRLGKPAWRRRCAGGRCWCRLLRWACWPPCC